MKKVPSIEVKKRSRELTSVFEAFSPYEGLKGKVERIWITEIATDGVHLVSVIEAPIVYNQYCSCQMLNL
jgi:threonylcarbamoyladenosine tRNA methylthiotransferase CDKAL1